MNETNSGPALPPRAQISNGDGPEELICSARRCRTDAIWALKWNNPRVHTPDRRKIWLSCDEHLERLTDFLGDRGYLCETIPVTEL